MADKTQIEWTDATWNPVSHRSNSRRPATPRPWTRSPARMFESEDAALKRANRTSLDAHTHWRVHYDIASRQHYITKHTYKPTGAGTASRSHQVLCLDGRWRASHRVALPNGALAG